MIIEDESTNECKSVFVIGADDYNMGLIQRSMGSDQIKLIPALTWDQVQPPSGRIDFNSLYRKAARLIDSHGGSPDAIIGYLDFPVTSIVSLLNRKYKLPGATPEAVARCEHKYWMRRVQAEVMADQTPRFAAINPFAPDEARRLAPPFPFWIKPVKGHSSVLGFLIRDAADLEAALHTFRQKIHYLGEPFNQFLAHLDDISELNGVDGNYAIAESLISEPRQFTLEAYIRDGKVTVYGAIDSHRCGMLLSSFSCYQYPAQLPDDVVENATRQSERMVCEIGLNDSAFNVEFYWDPADGSLHLLEINPRVSKSHGPLFHMVDGTCNHRVPIDLALGMEPSMPRGKGKDTLACKFMLRSFEADGIVRRVPREHELAELTRILPDIETNILVQPGTRLSTLFYQDSYSFELADVFLGGRDPQMINDAYARCCDSLQFHIQPIPRAP